MLNYLFDEKTHILSPELFESTIELRGYDGEVRQIIVRGNGREKLAFLITNDFKMPVELIKIHFDVIMTMIADTLYCRLAQQLRGFEDCDAPKIFRNFVKGGGTVEVRDGNIHVKFAKRAHNPVVRSVDWSNLPKQIPWLKGANLSLQFS